MTDATSTLTKIRRRLEEAGIDYMIVGSTVVGWIGHSRMTIDVDVVVNPSREQLLKLVRSLRSDDFYLDEQSALDALARRSMINAIDQQTGWKVDLIMLRDDEYERSAFARRQAIDTEVGSFPALTPEDLILSKLNWAKDSGSERQLRDIRGVFGVWRERLDYEYLRKWASANETLEVLEEIIRTAK